jgi:hypothetical protein
MGLGQFDWRKCVAGSRKEGGVIVGLGVLRSDGMGYKEGLGDLHKPFCCVVHARLSILSPLLIFNILKTWKCKRENENLNNNAKQILTQYSKSARPSLCDEPEASMKDWAADLCTNMGRFLVWPAGLESNGPIFLANMAQ